MPIQVLIAIAAIYNLEIHQIDVNIVFLNSELVKKIYVEQHQKFMARGQEKKRMCADL